MCKRRCVYINHVYRPRCIMYVSSVYVDPTLCVHCIHVLELSNLECMNSCLYVYTYYIYMYEMYSICSVFKVLEGSLEGSGK